MIALVSYVACLGMLIYVYALYPYLVRMLAALYGVPVRCGNRLPTVTVVVTAYNEATSIRAKLDNLTALSYPTELLDVLVVSDASTDATEQIAADYNPERVRVLRVEGRQGKTACQNAAAAAAVGEIIVFTDATTNLAVDSVRSLVARFADPSVGCVAGCLEYVSVIENPTGRGGESYWSYEVRLRAAESLFGSLIGVSGCLYAVRKSAYRAIEPTLISDFVVAMKMREQNLRTVLASDAICFEATLHRGDLELAMRVRVAIRSLNALISERRFLNPFVYRGFAWQLWSHKALRYLTPELCMGALAANVVLVMQQPHSGWYDFTLLLQCAVLVAGIVGFVLQHRHARLSVFEKPYYFLLTNLAALIATLRYLQGERMVTWKPIR